MLSVTGFTETVIDGKSMSVIFRDDATCPACAGPLAISGADNPRKLVKLDGTFDVTVKRYRCKGPTCVHSKKNSLKPFSTDWAGHSTYGSDVIAYVVFLHAKYRLDAARISDHFRDFKVGGIPVNISRKAVQNILVWARLAVAASLADDRLESLRGKEIVVALDALKPSADGPQVLVFIDLENGGVLFARSLSRGDSAEYASVASEFKAVTASYDIKVKGFDSDDLGPQKKAIEEVFPGIPVQACIWHFFRNRARELTAADAVFFADVKKAVTTDTNASGIYDYFKARSARLENSGAFGELLARFADFYTFAPPFKALTFPGAVYYRLLSEMRDLMSSFDWLYHESHGEWIPGFKTFYRTASRVLLKFKDRAAEAEKCVKVVHRLTSLFYGSEAGSEGTKRVAYKYIGYHLAEGRVSKTPEVLRKFLEDVRNRLMSHEERYFVVFDVKGLRLDNNVIEREFGRLRSAFCKITGVPHHGRYLSRSSGCIGLYLTELSLTRVKEALVKSLIGVSDKYHVPRKRRFSTRKALSYVLRDGVREVSRFREEMLARGVGDVEIIPPP